jgi:hypothetical protein
MKTMEEAIDIAKSFINKQGGEKKDFILQEAFIEPGKKFGKVWKVTLSFHDSKDFLTPLLEQAGIKSRRIYRSIEINSENGEVASMKAGFSSDVGVL